jgi:hypothetical protein
LQLFIRQQQLFISGNDRVTVAALRPPVGGSKRLVTCANVLVSARQRSRRPRRRICAPPAAGGRVGPRTGKNLAAINVRRRSAIALQLGVCVPLGRPEGGVAGVWRSVAGSRRLRGAARRRAWLISGHAVHQRLDLHWIQRPAAFGPRGYGRGVPRSASAVAALERLEGLACQADRRPRVS